MPQIFKRKSDDPYEQLDAARRQPAIIQVRIDALAAEVAELAAQKAEAAFLADQGEPGAEETYNKLDRQHASKGVELKRAQDALHGAHRKISEAEAAFNRAGKAKLEADIEAQNKQQIKHASKIDELLQQLASEWRGYFNAKDRALALMPGWAPEPGQMTVNDEIVAAFMLALRRVHNVEPTISNIAPPLPGADSNLLLGPNDLPSFKEQTERACAYRLRLLRESAQGPVAPAAQSAASGEPDTDGLTEIESASSGPKTTAAAVMATMRPKELV